MTQAFIRIVRKRHEEFGLRVGDNSGLSFLGVRNVNRDVRGSELPYRQNALNHHRRALQHNGRKITVPQAPLPKNARQAIRIPVQPGVRNRLLSIEQRDFIGMTPNVFFE
ncbi:hypothetical protein D1872_255440 [compost metagenome]